MDVRADHVDGKTSPTLYTGALFVQRVSGVEMMLDMSKMPIKSFSSAQKVFVTINEPRNWTI